MRKLPFFLSVILTGCASPTLYWTKSGFDPARWAADNTVCERQAAESYPPQFHTSESPGYTSPVNTNCTTVGGRVNCRSTGGESYPIRFTSDLNKENRVQFWDKCIRAKGYYTVSKNATKVPSQPNPIIGAISTAKTEWKSLCAGSEFAPLIKKSPCEEDEITFDQLADNSKATESDKVMISKLRGEEKKIEAKVISALKSFGGKSGQEVLVTLRKHQQLTDTNYIMLLEQRRSFGKFNRKRQGIKSRFEEELAKLKSKKQPG